MSPYDSVDPQSFRRGLTRNLALPLGVGLAGATLFVLLTFYLLHVIGLVERTDQVLRKATLQQKLSVEQESGLRGFLITGDQQFLAPYELSAPKLRAESASLQALVSDNPPQLDRLTRIEALQLEWNRYAEEMINLRRQNTDYLEGIRSGRGKRLVEEIKSEYDEFVSTERRARMERDEVASRNTVIVVGAYLAFSLSLTALLAFFGRRELLRLSASYGNALAQGQELAAGTQAQTWLREGQRRLADSMAGRQELGAQSHNALEFLTRYLGSAVGALYVREDNGRLERVASWGFSNNEALQGRSFAGSDSVVAEVATSGKPVRLENLPANYIRVTSGLGHGAPQSVLVAPIVNAGQVTGVVELGFLRPLAARDTDLLEMVALSLGASVEATLYRQRVQNLLEQTQKLNEGMQVNQKELRTANEELEEQSRALKESQAHLERQQAQLEQINLQLSEQRDALDDKNQALNIVQGELEQRAGELQRASRYKSEFLANMSHELRTPLNSTLILAQLLADNPQGNLSAEQIRFAESIHAAGNDLLNLINDILDISKVEAGKLDLVPEATGVAALAESLKRTFEPQAGAKSLRFELHLAPDLPATVVTDRQRAEQILKNLLSNAVKFTDSGTVSMTVSRHGDAALAFDVKDSGIGIAAGQQEFIFEAFRQADGTTSRRYGGTGLGLSISRDLAGLLGGSISVTSALGKGSTFTLVLPLQYQAAQASTPMALMPPAVPAALTPVASAAQASLAPAFADDRDQEPAPQQRRVLVVEDDPYFARILFDLAHEKGYSCLVAHHAHEAIQMAERFVPDAVLLDMRLPDDSGLSVLQHLKDNPRTRHIPVQMISVEDLHEAALQMGAIGYMLKPITREQLHGVFARIEAKLAQKVKRVLVVEGEARQRESISLLIGDNDIEIVAVALGEQALELLRGSVFDCMIIDLKLPDMTGNELLRRISGEDIPSFPPVIVYTGRNLSRDEVAELQRYSRSIIIKGARSPERLLAEVTLFLHKVESSLSSERQRMLKVARNRDKVFEGRRILLVDDDVRNIFALASALEHKGAGVETARNGREALEKLALLPEIDLVLMDMMMPEMDGYAATREIRKNLRWKNLPIIAVTAQAMRDDQERCLAAGVNDYLAKPVQLARLFSLIRVWIPKMERG